MFFRSTALILVAALMGGCASPLRIPLAPEKRADIHQVDTKVVVVQDEVIVDVQASNSSAAGAAGGLIGALVAASIDSHVTNSRVKSAQDLMGPFYAAIEDVDFRQEFNEAVRPSMAGYPIQVADVTTTPVALSNAGLRRWRDALKPGQCLLILSPRYVLSSDFRTLDAETWATIWTKDGDDKPIERGVLRYESAPMGAGGKESVDLWTANNAAAFRQVVKEAVAETMALVRQDLDVEAKVAKTAATKGYTYHANGGLTANIEGRVVSETATRVVVLGGDGRLYSLPKAATAAVAKN